MLSGLHGYPEVWTSVLAMDITLRALPSPGKENWPELASEHDKNKPRQWETGDFGQGLHIKKLGLALIH